MYLFSIIYKLENNSFHFYFSILIIDVQTTDIAFQLLKLTAYETTLELMKIRINNQSLLKLLSTLSLNRIFSKMLKKSVLCATFLQAGKKINSSRLDLEIDI